MDKRAKLIEIINRRSFLRSDEPIFRLASGKMSKVYFDLRLTTLSPEGQTLIGPMMLDKINELRLRPVAAGGLTMGADPVSCSLAYSSQLAGTPIEAFVIRKEPKDHGQGRQIEGNIKEGDKVVILDDVLTTGGSTIKAVTIARKAGLDVIAAIVVLDRMEQNGKANVEAHCPLYSLLTIADFKSAS